MQSQRKRIPIAKLVLDFNIYPRHKVDSTHVKHLAETMQAGHTLPPVIVDAKTMRVVDGFHRVRAARSLHGAEATMLCELRTYATEADVLADAIRLNAAHGRNLAPWDRARCIMLAEQVGLEGPRIAELLCVRIESLELKKVTRFAEYHNEPVPIKRTISHLAGQELTPQQVTANERAGGMTALFYVNQIISLLENDALDWSNTPLVERLHVLGGLIATQLDAHAA